MRTTKKDLDQLVELLNRELGRPGYGWNWVGDKHFCNVGALTLDGSYGGWRLEEVVNAGGGVREIGPRLSKPAMEQYLRAILTGIELAESNIGGYGTLPSWQPKGES